MKVLSKVKVLAIVVALVMGVSLIAGCGGQQKAADQHHKGT